MPPKQERIETRISADILDTIGKSFGFKHGKGVAEWLKNSLDNYLRLRELKKEPRSGNWPVFLNLIDSSSQKTGPNLAVLDFGGTGYEDVEEFLLHWGDKSAATLGGTIQYAAVAGGHGNGGKFYMREMWRGGARFATWRDGKATSLVIERAADGTTGYWEHKAEDLDWRTAICKALPASEGLGSADSLLDYLDTSMPDLASELDDRKRGFTIVVGRRAKQVLSSNDVVSGGKWNYQKLVDNIRDAPQARRPTRELAVSVFVNGALKIGHLSPNSVEEDQEWPSEDLMIPANVIHDISLPKEITTAGHLQIHKATKQLVGRLKDQNTISVMDSASNPIASYSVHEIPLPGHSPILSFMFADLHLTFPGVEDLVENDRGRLVNSPTTEALLRWVSDRIWERIQQVEDAQKDTQNKSELLIATVLNDALNQHAKRFLEELQTEIMVDYVQDPSGGGMGNVGTGIAPTGDGTRGDGQRTTGTGGGNGAGGTLETPGTSEHIRRPKFPQVLLSGIDADPAKEDGTSKQFTDRHPPLEQDDIDKMHNVWWINTQHPFAQEALKHGGAKGNAFKIHQLFMFRDVVQREGLRLLQRRENEMGLDRVENELSDFSNLFLADLPHDLIADLLG